MERRAPEQGSNRRLMVSGMLFVDELNELTPSTKKHVLSKPPVKNKDGHMTVMKEAIEELKNLEEKPRPLRIGVSYLVQFSHEVCCVDGV